MVAGARRELAVVQRPQFSAERLLGDGDAKLLPDPLDQIDKPPAYHPVNGGDRPLLDDGDKGRSEARATADVPAGGPLTSLIVRK